MPAVVHFDIDACCDLCRRTSTWNGKHTFLSYVFFLQCFILPMLHNSQLPDVSTRVVLMLTTASRRPYLI